MIKIKLSQTANCLMTVSKIGKHMRYPKPSLFLPMCRTFWGKTPMPAIRCGMLTETTRTARVSLRENSFFSSDSEFRPAEFMHFCSKMLVKEPKQAGKSPCMVLFCAFEQQFEFIELGKKYGLNHYINLVFRKNFSAQVLKANMKIVGNCEYGLVLYRNKLPKFNNNGSMVYNCFDWGLDTHTPKVHPTQKPVPLLERIIEIFTDKGDVVIDPCAGSGTTLLAATNLERNSYGFEVNKKFYNDAKTRILPFVQRKLFV